LTVIEGRTLLRGQCRANRGNELEPGLVEKPAVERADLGVRPLREATANPRLEFTLALRAQGARLNFEIVRLLGHTALPLRDLASFAEGTVLRSGLNRRLVVRLPAPAGSRAVGKHKAGPATKVRSP
jgi:hypothetical protein